MEIEKKVWVIVIIIFLIGILLGQFIGYYRAWNDSAPEISEYGIELVTTDLTGNATYLAGLNSSFSCVVFYDYHEAERFHKQVLEPALYEKEVCFKAR